MSEKTHTQLPPFVVKIVRRLEKAGFEAYIVGGAIRDLLMNRQVTDWDFTTNATPEQILEVFPEGFYNNVFGTVGLSHPSSDKPYEITTFRREFEYTDKRRPSKVEWGKTLEEDLSRRDFTINAMAIQVATLPEDNPSYKIIDPFGGQKDLEKKIIRAVGDPVERFNEDALRMMRAIRIAAELGFEIEKETFEAIKLHAQFINQISQERIKDELFKILRSDYPYEGMAMLYNSGIIAKILPEVETMFGVEQKSPGRHHIYDVGTHSLLALKFCPSNDPLVRFATLLHDVGKPKTQRITETGTITFYNHEIVGANIARKIADRLRLSKKETEKLVILIRRHQFTVDERQTDSAIRRFIKTVGKENIQDMLNLRIGDRLGGGAKETSWRLEKFKQRIEEVQKQPFSVKDLKINGHDIMHALGLKPGKQVGEILEKLFKEVEENQTKNDREYLLQRIKELK